MKQHEQQQQQRVLARVTSQVALREVVRGGYITAVVHTSVSGRTDISNLSGDNDGEK